MLEPSSRGPQDGASNPAVSPAVARPCRAPPESGAHCRARVFFCSSAPGYVRWDLRVHSGACA
eukprot:5633258-Pyramimonas_sp.AAC.1